MNPTSTFTLFSYWRSSASWRARIALSYKGISYRYEAMHLLRDGGEQHTSHYKALNPLEQVPLLVIEMPDGQVHRTSQSLAIIELLEELFPAPALLPSDPFLRARVRELAELVNSGIQPLQNLSVTQKLREELKGDGDAWTRYWNQRGLTALETQVRQSAGRFCVGDQVSIADICLVPQLATARRIGVDTTPYETLNRIDATCAVLAPFISAHPDQQPDAVR